MTTRDTLRGAARANGWEVREASAGDLFHRGDLMIHVGFVASGKRISYAEATHEVDGADRAWRVFSNGSHIASRNVAAEVTSAIVRHAVPHSVQRAQALAQELAVTPTPRPSTERVEELHPDAKIAHQGYVGRNGDPLSVQTGPNGVTFQTVNVRPVALNLSQAAELVKQLAEWLHGEGCLVDPSRR